MADITTMYSYVVFFVAIIIAVVIGYLMGRNSSGRPAIAPEMFVRGPGPNNLPDYDPYQEALEPENKLGKRIQTVA